MYRIEAATQLILSGLVHICLLLQLVSLGVGERYKGRGWDEGGGAIAWAEVGMRGEGGCNCIGRGWDGDLMIQET